MIVKVKECVHKNPPDTHQIQELIQRINATVDEDNVTFRNRWGSTFSYKGRRENIMDTLDHLPEELRSRSRSPAFTALKTEVDRVRQMLVMYEGLVESVKDIQHTFGKGYEGYDWRVRAEVVEDLHQAEYCFRHLCAREELEKALAETIHLLDAEECEAKGRAVAAAGAGTGVVKGSEKVGTDGRTFTMLWEGSVEIGFKRSWVELCLYGDQIERWIDGVKNTVLSETTARQLYPRMKTVEAARKGTGAQLLDMSQLLRRMRDVSSQ
jgi:hypothetical protein